MTEDKKHWHVMIRAGKLLSVEARNHQSIDRDDC